MKKTAIIFGATSGLGWEISKLLIDKEWNVLTFGRRLERLLGFKAGICNERHLQNKMFVGDVRKVENVTQAIKYCQDEFGSLNCVVSCAGIYSHYDSCSNVQLWHNVVETNFWGYFNIVNALLSVNFDSSSKPIPVFGVSSSLSQKCIKGSLPYSLSKLMLEFFIRNLTKDLTQEKIKCMVYMPKPFYSEMNPKCENNPGTVAKDLYKQIIGEV